VYRVKAGQVILFAIKGKLWSWKTVTFLASDLTAANWTPVCENDRGLESGRATIQRCLHPWYGVLLKS